MVIEGIEIGIIMRGRGSGTDMRRGNERGEREGREIETGVAQCTILPAVLTMMTASLVLTVIGTANDYDYQGTILSHTPPFYLEQYFIGQFNTFAFDQCSKTSIFPSFTEL